MPMFDVYWSPEGRKIATVEAAHARAAIRKAPQPYRKYLGEMYAEVVPQFYVSLVRDLIGYYLCFRADSEMTVRAYLMDQYYDKNASLWKLPWCRVYSAEEFAKMNVHSDKVIMSPVHRLYRSDYE